MRILTTAAALASLLFPVLLFPVAANADTYGPPAPITTAEIQQMLANQHRVLAKTPMAKQIGSTLNNDGAEAYNGTRTAPVVRRNAFGRTVDDRGANQKTYEPNDDSVVPQNPFGRRPFVHRMFQRPGTPVSSGSTLNN